MQNLSLIVARFRYFARNGLCTEEKSNNEQRGIANKFIYWVFLLCWMQWQNLWAGQGNQCHTCAVLQ